MPRQRLLAIGTSIYDADEFKDLEGVSDAVETIVDTFAALGFETRSLLNPTDTECKTTLEEWFQEVESWDDNDIAVLYLTGHGFSDGVSHFLAMTNTIAGSYAKVVETSFFIHALGYNPSLRRLLVLLDTCYAESGSDAMTNLARSMRSNWDQTVDRQYWVVSAARTKQEAQQLAFAQAFTQALTKLRGSSGTHPRFISLGSIIRETNLILEKPPMAVNHRATFASLIPASEEDSFFYNPHYMEDLTVDIPGDIAPANELDSHWIPRSRGGSSITGPSFFQGRKEAIDKIMVWALRDDDPGLLVVTGTPGTGKSALLAQFVVPQILTDELAADARSIQVIRAVFAHGLTLEEIGRRVEDLLSSPPADNPGRQVVIIDALDEAVDSGDIETLVLKPLLSAGFRVAVGARPKMVQSFRSGHVVIDLDQGQEHAAVTKYVINVLTSTPTSPYELGKQSTQDAASAVAELSRNNFLLAGHIARTLTRMERSLGKAEIERDLQSFGTLASVFENDLRRIDDETGLIREALTALAWARGAGLPWEGVWTAVCGALFSPRTYTDEDMQSVLNVARDYVVEILIEGRSYFRLYHELFAEYLRRGINDSDAHARISAALLDVTPTDEHGKRDWTNAHPYVLTTLAEHAAQGNKLDELLQDPQTVLALDPERLGIALGTIHNRQIGLNESAVLRCLDHLQSPNQHRMSQLSLAAFQAGATDLATAASALARQAGSWWTQWSRWFSLPTHTVLARLQGAVSGIRIVEYEGEARAIAVSKDGNVICIAVSSGRQIWDHHFDGVGALAVDGNVVAVATRAGSIHFFRIADGKKFDMLPSFDQDSYGSIKALAVWDSGQETLVATGNSHESNPFSSSGQLRLWSLSMPDQPKWTKQDFSGINTLDFRAADTGLQLVVGGCLGRKGDDSKSVARIFDVKTGDVCYKVSPDSSSTACYAIAHPDGSVLLNSDSGKITRWNPDTGEILIDEGLVAEHPGALSPDGAVWIIGGLRGLLIRSAATLQPIHSAFTIDQPSTVLAMAIIRNKTFVIAGTGEGELNRWDLDSLLDANLDLQRLPITAITTVSTTTDEMVTYSADDGKSGELVTVCLSDGGVAARRPEVHVSALHSTGLTGTVYVGYEDGGVRVLDAGTLENRGPQIFLHDGTVMGITDTKGLLITCGEDAQVQIVDISDFESGPIVPALLHERNKRGPLHQVRIMDLEGSSAIVALGYAGELFFWLLEEVLRGEKANKLTKYSQNVAKKIIISANYAYYSHALDTFTFCVWDSLKKAILIRSDRHGPVEMYSHLLETMQVTSVPSLSNITHVEMVSQNVLLTAQEGGVLRIWELPARRIINEIQVGASINCLCPVKEHSILVGTDSGIVFLNLI